MVRRSTGKGLAVGVWGSAVKHFAVRAQYQVMRACSGNDTILPIINQCAIRMILG